MQLRGDGKPCDNKGGWGVKGGGVGVVISE